jgi:hypothetical protein
MEKDSHTPPVGGRLLEYHKAWQRLGASPLVVSVLKRGYNIEFETEPPLSRTPWVVTSSTDPDKMTLLGEHFSSMLQKQAIEVVVLPQSLGFYSRLFLVPKKSGGLRPVTDLSALNQYILPKPFTMETAETVRTSLSQGMWTFSIDLSDAYFHVPIHPNSRKYLRIVFKGLVYQFKALPFGLKTAPWLFTMVFREVRVCQSTFI